MNLICTVCMLFTMTFTPYEVDEYVEKDKLCVEVEKDMYLCNGFGIYDKMYCYIDIEELQHACFIEYRLTKEVR